MDGFSFIIPSKNSLLIMKRHCMMSYDDADLYAESEAAGQGQTDTGNKVTRASQI